GVLGFGPAWLCAAMNSWDAAAGPTERFFLEILAADDFPGIGAPGQPTSPAVTAAARTCRHLPSDSS
ncbi:MAG: hypothetical protein ACRC7O_15285, partial [Fimbriiglobus sp.]